VIHFPAVGKKERAGAIADDIGVAKVQVCDQENIIWMRMFGILVLKPGMVTELPKGFLPPGCAVAVIPVHPPFFDKIIFRKDCHVPHDRDPDPRFIEQDRGNGADRFFT
jgi:hypothetical protein